MGAIGVIRVSGPDAISMVNAIFKGTDLTLALSHTIHFGRIIENDMVIDEVLVSVFKAPNSYTAENITEISCHGSPYILTRVLNLIIQKGARLAKPGEFTMRAFMNGKMDLAQAEAVADLVAADSENARQVAISQMRGGFSSEIKKMREKLVHFASMVELELDFAEEDVEFASREELKKLVKELSDIISALLSSFMTGNVIKNGVPTVIAGKPNSGKSTLLNAMLNEEKAIVSELEGTTRDFIEDEIHIEGFAFRFIDTAGIREARDRIEQMGIERTRQKMREASVIIYMFDLSVENEDSINQQVSELERLSIPYIKAGNKTDVASPALLNSLESQPGFIFISAKFKENLDQLKVRLIDLLDLGKVSVGDTIVTNARHYESLFKAKNALREVIDGMEKQASGELLAQDIRQSIYYLGEITGEITNEDLLENIFSKFCIGK